MDSQPPVLELKDVPPPPRPPASQPFPLAPLPMPPPCLPIRGTLPPPLQSGSPKVSSCSRYEAGLHPQTSHDLLGNQARKFGDVCAGGGNSITGGAGVGGGSSLYLSKPLSAASSWAATSSSSSSSSTSMSSTSSSTSSVPHHVSLFSGPVGQVPSSLATVATAQPMSSLPQLPCCSGLLKPLHAPTCPQLSQAYGQPSYGSCPAAATASSSGYYHYGGELGAGSAGKQSQQHPLLHHHHHHGGLSTSPAHVCAHPLHHKRTVCLKGPHYCQDCLSKVG